MIKDVQLLPLKVNVDDRGYLINFPIFWLIRRLYVRFVKILESENKVELTKYKSLEPNYDIFNKYLSSNALWMPFWYLCYALKKYNLGHQSLVLARKS